MISRDVIQPWVEKCIVEVIDEDHAHPDRDGDWPITLEHTTAFVRLDVDPGGSPRVQMFAPLLHDVPASPDLFEKLNALQYEASYVRFRWRNGFVEVISEVVAETLRPEGLRIVLSAIDFYAEQASRLLGTPPTTVWGPAKQEEGKADPVAAGEGEGETSTPAAAPARSRRKRGAKEAESGEERDPDQHPPPGYL